MPIPAGQVINNRYRVVSLLGQGGFGAVYRAWDLNLKKACALKENLELTAAAQRQFAREATFLANLSHPNLPRVTDHFSLPGPTPEAPPIQYLVMDYVEGQDLETMVEQRGALPERQALQWVGQVLDALEYLHSQKPPILHRDVKPANIRIRPDGQAVLVDFGLVKKYDPATHTTTGALAVSPGYSPPEQYGQRITDARSDIYALGATLYRILTGQVPQESVLRVAKDELRPAHLVNPELSPRSSAIIQAAIALSAEQRFPSAAAFKASLLTQRQSSPPQPIIPLQTVFTPGAPPTQMAGPVTATAVPAPPKKLATVQRFPLTGTVIAAMVIIFCVVAGVLSLVLWDNGHGPLAQLLNPRPAPTATRNPTDQPVPIPPLEYSATPTRQQPATDTPSPVVPLPAVTQPSPTSTLSPVSPPSHTPTPTRTPTPTITRSPTPPPIVDTGDVAGYDLAFASDRDGQFGLYLMNSSSRTWANLPRPSGYEWAWWPSFCGRYVAGEVADVGGSSPQWIYLVDPATGSNYLWDPPASAPALGVPRCSITGQYMAYSAGSGSDWDLIISDLAGTNSYVLDNNNLSGYASWYPDDNQMFSMAHIEGVFNIRYSIGLLSGSPSITSYVPGKYPAVSPNGNYLAYMCGENLNLCLRDLRTGSEQTLYTIEYLRINDVRMPSNPVWSADGQWIYFSSANSGDWDIYRIHSNGSGLENLTDDWGSSNELTPAYQW